MKKLSNNQITGQRGELQVADRTLAMGFAFHGCNRLETGIDGFLELRDPATGQTLAKWVGTQVKTTESERYSYEDESGFEYVLEPNDLAYWHGANIPVILILVRLSDNAMYWKSVEPGATGDPRRLRFDKAKDKFDNGAADSIAALCISKERMGSFVPPMMTGEGVHLTMVRVILPPQIFVGTSLFASGREAVRELVGSDPHASFDWVIRDRRFLSFRDPRGASLAEIVDSGSVEPIGTETIALTDDLDEEYIFIDLLARTLSAQLDNDLSYDRETRALYFRAPAPNMGRKYRYRSLINETSAEVVTVWRAKDGHVGSVRHHAFIPRFQRIGDEWLLSVSPTFIFTRDGYRAHYNASALVAGKKKKEKNGAIRGQFLMWRHLLIESGPQSSDLLGDHHMHAPILRFEALETVEMPLAVPEEAWQKDDPNAGAMVDREWLL